MGKSFEQFLLSNLIEWLRSRCCNCCRTYGRSHAQRTTDTIRSRKRFNTSKLFYMIFFPYLKNEPVCQFLDFSKQAFIFFTDLLTFYIFIILCLLFCKIMIYQIKALLNLYSTIRHLFCRNTQTNRVE